MGIITITIILSLLVAFTVYAIQGVEIDTTGDLPITTIVNVTDYSLPPISQKMDGGATIVFWCTEHFNKVQYDINDTTNKTRTRYNVTTDLQLGRWTDEHKPLYNGTIQIERTYYKTVPRYQTWLQIINYKGDDKI